MSASAACHQRQASKYHLTCLLIKSEDDINPCKATLLATLLLDFQLGMRIKFFHGVNMSQISLHNIFHVERMVIESQTGLGAYGLGDLDPKKKKKA